jgi:hypothetical protein
LQATPSHSRTAQGAAFSHLHRLDAAGARDSYYDNTFFFSSGGSSGMFGASQVDRELNAAIGAYRAANQNQPPTLPSQLTPYLKSAVDPAFIQLRLKSKN